MLVRFFSFKVDLSLECEPTVHHPYLLFSENILNAIIIPHFFDVCERMVEICC